MTQISRNHGSMSMTKSRLQKLMLNPNLLLQRGIVTVLSDNTAVQKFRQINDKSVLYFTATWCPPCKAISPKYEKMSDDYPEVAFGKVDVDENSDAAIDFEISAVPTFVLFQGETVSNKMTGADPMALEQSVKDLIRSQ